MTVSMEETNEKNSPQNGTPNTTETDHSGKCTGFGARRPCFKFQLCHSHSVRSEGYLLTSHLSNNEDINYNSQILHIIKSDIHIRANDVTEKVIKITFKSLPSTLLQ